MRTIGIAFLAQLLAATAEWSGSSFSDGNFRVQSACSALLNGEMFTFGGRGAGMRCWICPDTVVTYGGTKTVCNPILILNTPQNGVNCVKTPYKAMVSKERLILGNWGHIPLDPFSAKTNPTPIFYRPKMRERDKHFRALHSWHQLTTS